MRYIEKNPKKSSWKIWIKRDENGNVTEWFSADGNDSKMEIVFTGEFETKQRYNWHTLKPEEYQAEKSYRKVTPWEEMGYEKVNNFIFETEFAEFTEFSHTRSTMMFNFVDADGAKLSLSAVEFEPILKDIWNVTEKIPPVIRMTFKKKGDLLTMGLA